MSASEPQEEGKIEIPERKGPSILVVLGLVVVMLWATAAGLILMHPTANYRAKVFVNNLLGRDKAPSVEDEIKAAEERLAQERARLEGEQERLAKEEAALDAREAALTAREQGLDAREALIAEGEERLARLQDDINRIAKLCRQMRPGDAAELLEGLSDQQAIAVLKTLGDADAAKILAAMSRQRATALMKLMTPEPASVSG